MKMKWSVFHYYNYRGILIYLVLKAIPQSCAALKDCVIIRLPPMSREESGHWELRVSAGE